jgi:hypothetical protein
MYEYRVTKYDPALRDETGAFRGDDWTAVSDVGRSYGGVVFTRKEYDRVERAYVKAGLAFLREGGVMSVRVEQLETLPDHPPQLQESCVLHVDQLSDVIARILREEFWCNLEGDNGYLHFGYDYYLYIGVPQRCPVAEAFAKELGLFVESLAVPESRV